MLDSTTQARARSIAKMAVDALRVDDVPTAARLLADSPEPAVTVLLMFGFDPVIFAPYHVRLLRMMGFTDSRAWLPIPTPRSTDV